MEVYLVLSRSPFMVRPLRGKTHTLYGKRYFSTYIFAFICRGYVHVAGFVIGDLCGITLFVLCKKVELRLGSETEFNALVLCCSYSLYKD